MEGVQKTPEEIRLADSATREIINQPIGWVIAKQLIENPQKSEAVMMMASKLMLKKISCYFDELHQTDYMPLF
jgi:hypothetical protein